MSEAQTDYAEINGAKLYFEVAGEGHLLVMVHAGIADSRMWDDQFPEFAKQYRTIRYDQRGYGNSEPVDSEYSFREDLAALLKFLNVEQTYLIGCSMGGGTCMDFTLEHPEMVGALIMVGSGPSGLNLDVPEPALVPEIMKASDAKDWEKLLELETQLFFDGEGRTPDQVDQQVRQRAVAMNRQAIAHEAKGLGKPKPSIKPSAAERLGDLHLPVLAIYGDRDEAYAHMVADYMEQHIAGAQKVMIPNTAHLPNMEQPAAFNGIVLDFLKKIS
ncbi:MAG: alpha/beta hydrolase [Chloroflexota bacterium]